MKWSPSIPFRLSKREPKAPPPAIHRDPPPPPDDKPTLTIGVMSSRFRHPVTRAFLAQLGIQPATTAAGQWLYLESQWPAITRAVAANALAAGLKKDL